MTRTVVILLFISALLLSACKSAATTVLAIEVTGQEVYVVWNLAGGMVVWEQAGLPLER